MAFDFEYVNFVYLIGKKGREFIPTVFATLGLVGETAEAVAACRGHLEGDVEKEDVLKELGDVLWYATALAINVRIPPTTLRPTRAGNSVYFGTEAMCQALQDHVGVMADKCKKVGWHDRETSPAELRADLSRVVEFLDGLARRHGTTLDEIADINVAKLKARWPNGFGVAK